MALRGLAALILLAACSGQEEPPVLMDETASVVETAVETALAPTTGLHVVEDIIAMDSVVMLSFRPEWESHDSIQATTSAGTLTRHGLTWLLSGAPDALVTLRVCQTLLDANGRLRTVCPTYQYRVQVGAPRLYTIPEALDATGKTNVCGASDNRLERWLASVPHGSIIQGADGARYRCDYGVTLTDRWNLSFVGRVTLFSDYDSFAPRVPGGAGDPAMQRMRLISFNRGGNLSIDGWTFQGPRPRALRDQKYLAIKETQHGLEFRGTNGVTLSNIRVEHVWGDFVNLSFAHLEVGGAGLIASEPTRHVEISGSTFRNSGRQGIAMTGLYDAKIYDNTFAEVQRSLWDFEPGGTFDWVQRVDIYSNTIIGRVRNNVVAGNGRGIWMQDITIRDNDFGPKPFRLGFGGGIGGGPYRKNLSILRNTTTTVLASSLSPIEISGFDSVTINGNVMPMQARRGKPAVLLQNQIGYSISDNIAVGARVMWRWEADKRDSLGVVIEDGLQVAP